MSNEELVKLIQDGQTEYIPQLWDQVYLFICSMAKKRLIGEAEYIKQLEEDMVNESYFAFLEAVRGYKFDRESSFLTYLTYGLKTSFNRVLGLRTQKDRQNPMRYAVSLDTPLEHTEDLTLRDMLIDHMSEEEYQCIDEEFWEDVHELLETAIYKTTAGKSQEILLVMLHENSSLADACRIAGTTLKEQRTIYNNAFYNLRRYLRGRGQKQCREIGLTDYFQIGIKGTGLSSYQQHCFTSSTEWAAVKLADAQMQSRKIGEMFS